MSSKNRNPIVAIATIWVKNNLLTPTFYKVMRPWPLDTITRWTLAFACVAALSLGCGAACLDLALDYAKQRRQFDQPISHFQGIQFKLADMAVAVENSRLITYKAAWLYDQGREFAKEAAMAKLYASDTAMHVASEAVQIHGGYGYTDEYVVSRFFRDAKILQIGEGTNEIQRMVIARLLGC